MPSAATLFTLSVYITPLWILSGAVLGFKGLWDEGASKKWLVGWMVLSAVLIIGSWLTGAQQIAAQQRQDDMQATIEADQREMNRRQDALNGFQQQLGQSQQSLNEKESSIAKQVSDIARLSEPKPTIQPDVEVRFIGAQHPAPLLINLSNEVAREIKWWVELWNLDRPPTQQSQAWNPLLIPVQTFDYIRPHEIGGPQEIFNTPLVTPSVSIGNHLFGYATATCPNCVTTRSVWVYIEYGKGGWYSPLPASAPFVDVKVIFKGIPMIAKNTEEILGQMVPPNSRMPIQNQ